MPGWSAPRATSASAAIRRRTPNCSTISPSNCGVRLVPQNAAPADHDLGRVPAGECATTKPAAQDRSRESVALAHEPAAGLKSRVCAIRCSPPPDASILRSGGVPFPLTAQPSVPRRSVYGFIERGRVPGLLSAFDFASPDQHAPDALHHDGAATSAVFSQQPIRGRAVPLPGGSPRDLPTAPTPSREDPSVSTV